MGHFHSKIPTKFSMIFFLFWFFKVGILCETVLAGLELSGFFFFLIFLCLSFNQKKNLVKENKNSGLWDPIMRSLFPMFENKLQTLPY